MADIENLLEDLLDREGGYSDHPADRGGPTNWGITQAVAKSHGYSGSMRDFSRARAKEIYRDKYWHAPGYANVAAIAPNIAAELFDTGVNMGTSIASNFLQRALNALNRNQKDFPDLRVDRTIGPKTLDALRQYLKIRGQKGADILLKALNALQGERYISLAESRSANEAFLYGWLANRIG